MSAIYLLEGVVKNYDWGGTAFLPHLLGSDNTSEKPFAEYWMGTHKQGMAHVLDQHGQRRSLSEMGIVLPYLLKVLDIREMLSIQVHPTREAAISEFALENKAGVPLDAPHRNYKDQNHKPELMVALSSFWLLHGFKNAEQLRIVFDTTPEFNSLKNLWENEGNQALYQFVMEMSQQDVNSMLGALLNRLQNESTQSSFEKDNPAYWALRASLQYRKNDQIDRGIFSIYFFNLVSLREGEAIFQNAGIPHAYLEGQNVEIMANSDNVLRGGLTSKHIDVAALLKHIDCRGIQPEILHVQQINDKPAWFSVPVEDFKLGLLLMKKNEKYQLTATGPLTLLLLKGAVELTVRDSFATLKQGQLSAYWDGEGTLYLQSDQDTTLYLATSAIHSSE
ncbi:MAG: mannose-6-phosphate isomerase, class I [Bacteroidetes bacterium]|nr:mannose-6-phosphate isomerase, class I [Bacteroidota bacterium]